MYFLRFYQNYYEALRQSISTVIHAGMFSTIPPLLFFQHFLTIFLEVFLRKSLRVRRETLAEIFENSLFSFPGNLPVCSEISLWVYLHIINLDFLSGFLPPRLAHLGRLQFIIKNAQGVNPKIPQKHCLGSHGWIFYRKHEIIALWFFHSFPQRFPKACKIFLIVPLNIRLQFWFTNEKMANLKIILFAKKFWKCSLYFTHFCEDFVALVQQMF